MMPTLSFKSFDCRADNIGQYTVINVSLTSLLMTVEPDLEYVMLIGYSFEDHCFADPELLAAFTKFTQSMLVGHPNVHVLLKPFYATKCGTTILWNTLADWGYNIGCDYFIPGNDDVVFITPDWASKAIAKLRSWTTPCRNFGIVAFRDQAYDNFPTFHVISRLHIFIHKRAYYPVSLVGLGVDPWVFKSYEAVGQASMLNIFVKNYVMFIGYDGIAVSRNNEQLAPRYDHGSNDYGPWVTRESQFLREWMSSNATCCDSFDCSPPQIGSPLGKPLGSVEHYA